MSIIDANDNRGELHWFIATHARFMLNQCEIKLHLRLLEALQTEINPLPEGGDRERERRSVKRLCKNHVIWHYE